MSNVRLEEINGKCGAGIVKSLRMPQVNFASRLGIKDVYKGTGVAVKQIRIFYDARSETGMQARHKYDSARVF